MNVFKARVAKREKEKKLTLPRHNHHPPARLVLQQPTADAGYTNESPRTPHSRSQLCFASLRFAMPCWMDENVEG